MPKKEIVEQQQDWVADPQNTLIALDKQANANIQALATQLGYDGSLTVGALEDEIRFYQRRTVEAALELGKRLLLLKEVTPHGDFQQRLGLLGFGYDTANRFMKAALKTSKSRNLRLLAQEVDSTSKFLELITLDDEELTELTEGGSARGITLDNISTMSVTELRKALRDAKADTEAKDALLAKKDEKINSLDAELTKRSMMVGDESLRAIKEQESLFMQSLNEAQNNIILAVQQFHIAIDALQQNSTNPTHNDLINDTVSFVYQTIADTANELGIPINFSEMVSPSWMKSDNNN